MCAAPIQHTGVVGAVEKAVVRKRLGKHVADFHAAIELLGAVFSMRSEKYQMLSDLYKATGFL